MNNLAWLGIGAVAIIVSWVIDPRLWNAIGEWRSMRELNRKLRGEEPK